MAMRTLRAFFWGSVVGAILGFVFAPRHSDVLRAELAEAEYQRQAHRTATATATAGTPAGTSTARQANAPYVGNAHTKVYHASTDTNLPDEENRVYFDSAADAEALGYRPAGRLSSAS